MKRKPKHKRLTLNILLGVVCFGLLAVFLYLTQIAIAYQTDHDNAMTELIQIRDQLASQPQQEDFADLIELFLKTFLQKSAVFLTDVEINDEVLMSMAEQDPSIAAMMVFHEDGSLLSSCGSAVTDPDFLLQLQNGHVEKVANDLYFAAVRLKNGLYLAVGTIFDTSEEVFKKRQYDMSIVDDLSNYMTGCIVVVNRVNDRVLYGPDSILGMRLSDIMPLVPQDASSVKMLYMENSFKFAAALEYEDYLLMSLFDFSDMMHKVRSTTVPALLGFGFLIFLLLAYTEFIRTDMCKGWLGKIHYVQFGKKHYLNTLLLRKLVGFAMIGIACMICVVCCSQLLVRSDAERQNAEKRLDIAARILEESQAARAVNEQVSLESIKATVYEVKTMLEFNPNLLSEDGLNSLARLHAADGICVLDHTGKAVAATTNFQGFALSNDYNDATYPFWDVINNFVESHAQIVPNDPYVQGNNMLYVGISNGNGQGMLLVVLHHELVQSLQSSFDPDVVLQTVSVDNLSSLLVVKAGSTTCVFDSSGHYTGLDLGDFGIEETYLRNGYSGTHQFFGQDSLITTRSVLDWHLLYITPIGLISSTSWFFTTMVIVIGLLVVMTTVLPLLLVRSPGEDLQKVAHKAHSVRNRSHVDAVLGRDGQIELVESHVAQKTVHKRWSEKRASAKLNTLVRVLLGSTGGFLLFLLLLTRHSGSSPLINRILAQNWDKSLNVYAVSYVVIVVSGIWIIAELLQKLSLFVTGTFSRRWKTVGILLSNIIRYVALIISIFFTLQNFGVQTSTLATSASLLTLIVGLGCQNFVADLVAGIFLLFEGTFRVGDIVTIDNWHGEVLEIGLRSTKVKNEVGNVKVFQNSRISGAINMTQDITFAVCDIPLPPGESLEAYENKLTTSFFPEAAKNIEAIRHPLVYEGVVSMNGDNAILRISVKCLEHDREQIRRELYRTLKLWREQNAKNPPANA